MSDDETMFTLGVYEPGAGFDWHGSLDAMVWYGEKPKPTADELAAVWESSGRAEYAAARNAVAAERRAPAYRDEADPLFFKWQRGESTEQDWLDAVAAIRERFPYES